MRAVIEERPTPAYSDGGGSPQSESGRPGLVINMPEHEDSTNVSNSVYDDEHQFTPMDQHQRKLGFGGLKFGKSLQINA